VDKIAVIANDFNPVAIQTAHGLFCRHAFGALLAITENCLSADPRIVI
jgi:hypothetical protein